MTLPVPLVMTFPELQLVECRVFVYTYSSVHRAQLVRFVEAEHTTGATAETESAQFTQLLLGI